MLAIFIMFATVVQVNADVVLEIADEPQSNGFPQWSPDGERIIYYALAGENNIWNTNIKIMDSNGKNQSEIAPGKHLGPFFIVFGFSQDKNIWSPDGNKIIYSSTFGLNIGSKSIPLRTNFGIMNIDGTGKQKLKGTSSAESCKWVQNGTKIFMVDRSNKLWLINPDGTNKVLLTQGEKNDSQFLWQPRGNKIIYISKKAGNSDIWIMNSNGSEKKQLTFTNGNENNMDWSFDGSQIVYSYRDSVDKTNYENYLNLSETIRIMDSNGKNKKQLTTANRNWDTHPQWSPDGTKITFQRMDVGTPYNIALINSDGSNLTILTENKTSDILPQWSPKEDKIAFTSSKDENMFVSVITLDDEWKSAPAKDVVSVPTASQEKVEKASGFTGVLVAITFSIAFVLQKKKTN